MSRPCTDWPITLVSVTRAFAIVVVVDDVEVVVDVGFGVVVDVVGDDVGATVVSTATVEVGSAEVDACSVAAGDADGGDSVVESDEHASTTCDATSSAHHDDRRIIAAGYPAWFRGLANRR